MDRFFIVKIPSDDVYAADSEGCNGQELAAHIRDELRASCGAHHPQDSEFLLLRNVTVRPINKGERATIRIDPQQVPQLKIEYDK